MDQKQLKTAWKTRIIVGIIAFLMLFSTVAVYALIVLSSENKKKTDDNVSAEMKKVEGELGEKRSVLEELAKGLSEKHLSTLSSYRNKVKSYNEGTVNKAGLKTFDIKNGNGAEIKEDSTYFSYYIGWCPDESVFDSSFDDFDKPTELRAPIAYEAGTSSFVAGWEEGVIGMKVGGVREIDVPSTLAYGETREICGGKNKPLKFIVYAIDPGKEYLEKTKEYNKLVDQYYELYYSQNQDYNGN